MLVGVQPLAFAGTWDASPTSGGGRASPVPHSRPLQQQLPSWPQGWGGVSCFDPVTPPALSWAQEGRPSWSCPRGAQGRGSGLHRDPDLGQR